MKLVLPQPAKPLLLPLLVIVSFLVAGGYFLREYLLWDSQWLLALVLIPVVAQVQLHRAVPPTLLVSATALAIVAATLQNSTFYFFAFMLALWCGVQLIVGKISVYPLLLLVVASPIFKYIANIISFPLRMQLTAWAVSILKTMETQAEAAGNIILVNGEEFSVDPACAGLSMLSLSLVLAVFILAHLQKRSKKVLPFWFIAAMLGFMIILNLASNLLRILLLVWFKILPSNPLHDALGLLCLVCYALVPFYFITSSLLQRVPGGQRDIPSGKQLSLKKALLFSCSLLFVLTAAGVQLKAEKPTIVAQQKVPQLAGFQATTLENGVIKYSNDEMLVYNKPVQAFYSTEHHPLICWEGSGYKFRHVQQRRVGNHKVYVGELQKGNDTLYTAWWMDNGQHQTIDQWDWRTRMLKGEENFSMVNVTVARKQDLHNAIVTIIQNNHNYSQALKAGKQLSGAANIF